MKEEMFLEISEDELFDVEGGVAPLLVYAGAVLIGGLVGYGCGYVFG